MVVLDMAPDEMKTARQPGQSWRAGGGDCRQIVIQAAVPVLDGDDESALASRVLAQEHVIYPLAIRWFVEGRLHLLNGKAQLDLPQDERAVLISPWTV